MWNPAYTQKNIISALIKTLQIKLLPSSVALLVYFKKYLAYQV